MPDTSSAPSPQQTSLQALFSPRSVAVIGASSDAKKIGGLPVHFMKTGGFDGAVYPINPKATTIQGLPAYSSLSEVAGPVDLVVVAVPGHLAAGAFDDCIAKGVQGVIMFSAGFAEVDDTGRAQQEAMAAKARANNVRLMGPNCLGMVNFRRRLAASFHPAFGEGLDVVGNVGLVSQSGAFGGLSYAMGRERGLAFSAILTTGNEADVDVADCLSLLASDDDTDVILLYMEGCRNGAKLIDALALAHRNKKSVIAIKLGRTEAGAAAAASHTAALAGSDAVFDAVFRQYGVYRAASLEEFFDIGYAASFGRLPRTDTVGLVTVSGGIGVLMADEAALRGLDVAPLRASSQQEIKTMVPFAGTGNPVDITGQVINDIGLYGRAVDIVVRDGDYGSLACFHGSAGRHPIRKVPIAEMWKRVSAEHPDTVIAVTGMNDPDFETAMQQAGCLSFVEPTHAIRALAALRYLGQARDLSIDPPVQTHSHQSATLPAGPLNEIEALGLLHRAGLPTVTVQLVDNPEAAVDAAQSIGFPVAMKIVSADILHKSDIGGVALNLGNETAVRRSFADLVTAGKKAAPDAVIDGCLVAPMAQKGVETILGVHRDPTFGPVVMFGLGGIFVETLKDVAFRLAPFSAEEALRMIAEVKGYPLLCGQRGQPAADLQALANALAQLSQFAAANAETLVSVDVNPFIVHAEGATAVDAVIVTASSTD